MQNHMETIIVNLLFIASIYLVVGLIFAIIFLIKGISKVDSNMNGASIGVKLLLLPGLIFLWPYFLYRWIQSKS